MAKKKKNDSYKVWAFMINAHAFILLSQDGKKIAQVAVENGEDEAKTLLTDSDLMGVITAEIQREEYQILWVDDPVEDKEVFEACKAMEQKESEKLLAEAVGSVEHIVPEEGKSEEVTGETHPENIVDDWVIVKINIERDRCEIKTCGKWMSAATKAICPGDIFRVSGPTGKALNDFECIEKPVPESDKGDEVDYIIKARIFVAPEDVVVTEPEAKSVEKKFKPAPKTKMVDIECQETNSEHKMKILIREIVNLKNARLASQQEYNEQIKVAEKALYAAAEGKAFKPMECTLEEDWEAGERRYIRPDNGEVALREEIPYEERQLKLDLPVPEPAAESNETPESEAIVDESALTPEVIEQNGESAELLTDETEAAENVMDFDSPEIEPNPEESEESRDQEEPEDF